MAINGRLSVNTPSGRVDPPSLHPRAEGTYALRVGGGRLAQNVLLLVEIRHAQRTQVRNQGRRVVRGAQRIHLREIDSGTEGRESGRVGN